MVKILKSNSTDWNIGLYVVPLDKIILIGENTDQDLIKEIKENTCKDIVKVRVNGLSIISVFMSAWENKIVISRNISDREEFKEKVKEKYPDIIFVELDSNSNAVGNNLIIYNDKVLVNKNIIKQDIEKLKDYFKEVEVFNPSFVESIGQLIVSDGKSALISNLLNEEEISYIVDYFKFKDYRVSTINFGSPFLKSGIVICNKSIIVGRFTSPIELLTISELFKNGS